MLDKNYDYIVSVFGTPRTRTSFTMNVVNALGGGNLYVEAKEETTKPENTLNPGGYFENPDKDSRLFKVMLLSPLLTPNHIELAGPLNKCFESLGPITHELFKIPEHYTPPGLTLPTSQPVEDTSVDISKLTPKERRELRHKKREDLRLQRRNSFSRRNDPNPLNRLGTCSFLGGSYNLLDTIQNGSLRTVLTIRSPKEQLLSIINYTYTSVGFKVGTTKWPTTEDDRMDFMALTSTPKMFSNDADTQGVADRVSRPDTSKSKFYSSQVFMRALSLFYMSYNSLLQMTSPLINPVIIDYNDYNNDLEGTIKRLNAIIGGTSSDIKKATELYKPKESNQFSNVDDFSRELVDQLEESGAFKVQTLLYNHLLNSRNV